MNSVTISRQRIPLSSIRTDTPPREKLNWNTVESIFLAFAGGDDLPPVTVFTNGSGAYWLADGYHRFEAIREAGVPDIDAEIHRGDIRDALRYSLSANTNEQRNPRLLDDRKRAVQIALRDPEWAALSDYHIGKLCAVHPGTVRQLRVVTPGARPQTPRPAPGQTPSQQLILQLHAENKKPDEIARLVNRTRDHVTRVIRMFGEPVKPKRRPPEMRTKSRVPRPRDTLEQIVLRVEAIAHGLEGDDMESLVSHITESDARDWVSSLNYSIRQINAFRNSLKTKVVTTHV